MHELAPLKENPPARPASPPAVGAPGLPGVMGPAKPARLVSLDAYRGLIMITLMSGGLGFKAVAKHFPDSPLWQRLAFNTDHPEWLSAHPVDFGAFSLPLAVSYWDLIQPSFMFMVGVAMPFSYSRRAALGQSPGKALMHVLIRSAVLVLLGIVLTSKSGPQVNWGFTNVLSQIGLGYTVAYLYLGKPLKWQLAGCGVLLVGTVVWFWLYPAPPEAAFGHWTKNANVGSYFDGWLLNLFPSHKDNGGGYNTLNFVPSIVTMILGVMCGELLRSERHGLRKVGLLALGGLTCMVLGVLIGMINVGGQPLCPIVKRIWTPSWVLFSGAYVMWILAAFYLVCDVIGLRKWAFVLVVVGMNSIAAYVMEMTVRGWTAEMLRKFFNTPFFRSMVGEAALAPKTGFFAVYGPMVEAGAVLLVFWLILYWLYRQKAFIRI